MLRFPGKEKQPPAREANHSSVQFKIGEFNLTDPLVTVDQVKGHLNLLRAFKYLRQAIEERVLSKADHAPGYNWDCVLSFAVERFRLWLSTLGDIPDNMDIGTWIEEYMPPLDVLMVWHTYLLNPSWYAEDCDRLSLLRPLAMLRDRLVYIGIAIPDLHAYKPSKNRSKSWREVIGTSWAPVDAIMELLSTTRAIECPVCERTIFDVPFVAPGQAGYVQSRFSARCRDCYSFVTRSTLAARRFAGDMWKDPENPDHVKIYGNSVYLAGTLFTSLNATDSETAAIIKKALRTLPKDGGSNISFQVGSPLEEQARVQRDWVAANTNATPSWVRSALIKSLKLTNIPKNLQARVAQRVYNAYFQDRLPGPFSVDLVGAMARQSKFIDRMEELKWTRLIFLKDSDNEIVFTHAISRYHNFLDLMARNPESMLVPTLDIDLVWHTHQMMGNLYSNQCLQYVHRHIDHDDSLQESVLGDALDVTCRLWQQSYNVTYMQCGCSLPRDSLGDRLSRLTNRLHISSSPTQSSLPEPPHPSSIVASHASEHPATCSTAAESIERRKELDKRRKQELKEVSEGKMSLEVFRQRAEHANAFAPKGLGSQCWQGRTDPVKKRSKIGDRYCLDRS